MLESGWTVDDIQQVVVAESRKEELKDLSMYRAHQNAVFDYTELQV